MGFLDRIASRYHEWQARRDAEKAAAKREKQARRAMIVAPATRQQQQQQQQVTPAPQRHAAYAAEDELDDDEPFDFAAEPSPWPGPRHLHQPSPSPSSSSSSSPAVVPTRRGSPPPQLLEESPYRHPEARLELEAASVTPSRPRAASPTSVAHMHSSVLATPQRAHAASSGPFSSARAQRLSSSPVSHSGALASSSPFRSASVVRASIEAEAEGKEEQLDDEEFEATLARELEALGMARNNAVAANAIFSPASSSSSATAAAAPHALSADERLAELLQRQEYEAYLEEGGQQMAAGDEPAAAQDQASIMLLAQLEQQRRDAELQRAQRRQRRADALAAGLAPPRDTPSPAAAFDEEAYVAPFRVRSASHAVPASSSSSSPAARSSSSASSSSSSSSSRAVHPRTGALSRSELAALPSFAYEPRPKPRARAVSHPVATSVAPCVQVEGDTSKLELQVEIVSNMSSEGMTLPTCGVDMPTLEECADESTEGAAQGEEEEELEACSICLADFERTEVLRALPCLHKFHVGCIDDWLHRSSLCPNCNSDVREAFQ